MTIAPERAPDTFPASTDGDDDALIHTLCVCQNPPDRSVDVAVCGKRDSRANGRTLRPGDDEARDLVLCPTCVVLVLMHASPRPPHGNAQP